MNEILLGACLALLLVLLLVAALALGLSLWSLWRQKDADEKAARSFVHLGTHLQQLRNEFDKLERELDFIGPDEESPRGMVH